MGESKLGFRGSSLSFCSSSSPSSFLPSSSSPSSSLRPASRGDIVVFTPNYRLGTLGFLSSSPSIPGNYALSDLISALKYIQKYGPLFGADPSRITIAGQSAGAQLVVALLSSPQAQGLFHSAIVMSTRPADSANALPTQETAWNTTGKSTVESLGCGGLSSESKTTQCLKALDVSKFIASGSQVFNKLVVDNDYITSSSLGVTKDRQLSGSHINRVPVIWGFQRDELASLGSVPPISQTNLDAALTTAGIDANSRSIVENNPSIFPIPNSPNGVQNVSVTVETLIKSIAKCGQISTLDSIVRNGIFDRIWSYTFDHRSWQIDNFIGTDCQGRDGTGEAYHCHSGDLMPLFS